MSGFNLSIELQCPQCGAPAELEETCRVFTCGFCRVKSYLVTKDYFRYVIPCSPDSPERELIRVPYWRLKGTLFSFTSKGVHKRFMDISHLAISSPCFPGTLGLRTQAMKLRFLSPEDPGFFLQSTLPMEKTMSLFSDRFNASLPSPALHQEFVGENLSLIYAPFYMEEERITDAVLNQTVSAIPPASDPRTLGNKAADWRMRFVPTLCPSCGWDMQGEPDALVLICRNCESAWQSAQSSLGRITFGMFPAEENSPAVWFPFWRIQAHVSGIRLQSYADLIRTANLIKVVQEGDEESGFYFWAPAFKVQPRFFISLSRQMTLCQPREKPIRKLPEKSLIPVNFPVSEAVKSLKINLAGFIKPPGLAEKRIGEIQIRPRKYLLVYVPFREDHHDYYNKNFQMTVNKNMLGLSKNL